MRLTLFADGGARGNPGPAAAGAVLLSGSKEITSVSQFLGNATNNEAEYAAVILGLRKALELQATEIEIQLDSKLVVEQLAGRWKIKDLKMRKLAEKAHVLLEQFSKWEIQHIPREQNEKADALVNQELAARGFEKKLSTYGGFRNY